jgi:hypothetical protein
MCSFAIVKNAKVIGFSNNKIDAAMFGEPVSITDSIRDNIMQRMSNNDVSFDGETFVDVPRKNPAKFRKQVALDKLAKLAIRKVINADPMLKAKLDAILAVDDEADDKSVAWSGLE